MQTSCLVMPSVALQHFCELLSSFVLPLLKFEHVHPAAKFVAQKTCQTHARVFWPCFPRWIYIYIFFNVCIYIYNIQIFTYLCTCVHVFICRAIVVGMSECSCFHTTFGGKLPGALPAFVYRRFLKRPIRGVLLGGLSPLLQELLLRFAGQVLQGSSHLLLLPILRNGRRSWSKTTPHPQNPRRQVHGTKKQWLQDSVYAYRTIQNFVSPIRFPNAL